MRMSDMMTAATPRRKNRRRDPYHEQEQHRRYEVDSHSCSSSESGGISPLSNNMPLHLEQEQQQRNKNSGSDDCSSPSHSSSTHHDNSSAGTPPRSRTLRNTVLQNPSTPTPTTTIERARSPRSNGKLSRPRRRGHRSTSNLHQSTGHAMMHGGHCHNKKSMQRVGSLTSIGSDSVSEHSLVSRYTAASKNSGISLSRRGGVGSVSNGNLYGQNGSSGQLHGHSFSSNSLFGLKGGSTYSKFAGVESMQEQDSYDYYHKDHHPPNQHLYESPSSSSRPTSPSASSLPPLPSIKVIASELSLICSLYCRYAFRKIRKPCRKLRRRFCHCFLTLAIVVLALIAWLSYDFYADALDVCTPPPSSFAHQNFAAFLASAEGETVDFVPNEDGDGEPPRPLVEYYVHGRGIGHYARSVAIVEQLNRAGVDVRMFLTRASMWRAMHEDAKIIVDADDEKREKADGQNHQRPAIKRGKTTAIPISSLTPDQGFFTSLSHTLERVSGDCEVSATSGRYPQLIVTDGDFPGMLRAEMGGIPSVGIAHGQLFSIAQKPTWVQASTLLNGAWNKQGRLNSVSSWFTEWQIATHFCFLESRFHSGTVARAPLRPEVLKMAEARRWARRGKVWPSGTASASSSENSWSLPQAERIQTLLMSPDKDKEKAMNSIARNHTFPTASHRKLVICYFRDHNGERVVQALLKAGFDVLVFDTHYTREMDNNPNRYGVKWIVPDKLRDQERKKYIPVEKQKGSDTDAKRLRGGRKLLEVSEDSTSPNVGTVQNRNAAGSTSLNEIGHHFEVNQRHEDGPKEIRVMDRSLFVPLMHVADGVASSAGSQLMSECIYSHMPLLALYKEDDSEQRLNVELSHHVDAPCHRPLVFGNSFEHLESALKSNFTVGTTGTAFKKNNDPFNSSPIPESFQSFVREVELSSVSDTYYRNADLLGGKTTTKHGESSFEKQKNNDVADAKDPSALFEEDDPFRGLPDAAAIILEIVKQVIQKG